MFPYPSIRLSAAIAATKLRSRAYGHRAKLAYGGGGGSGSAIAMTTSWRLSTINRVLYHSGLVKKRRRYRPAGTGLPERPVVAVTGPNDLWTVDFKGWWRTGDGTRCDPLTVRDALSRYVLDLRLLKKTDGVAVRAVFERLFDTHGLPKAIQSGNGPPFASRGLAGVSTLSAWWLSLGIEVVRSRPGKPTDNGGHERMHVDISIDIQEEAAFSLKLQPHACDAWRDEFNHIRPHDALGLKFAHVHTPRLLVALVVDAIHTCNAFSPRCPDVMPIVEISLTLCGSSIRPAQRKPSRGSRDDRGATTIQTRGRAFQSSYLDRCRRLADHWRQLGA